MGSRAGRAKRNAQKKKEKTTQTRKALKQRKGEGTSKPATAILWCGRTLALMLLQGRERSFRRPATPMPPSSPSDAKREEGHSEFAVWPCRTAPVGHEMQLTKLPYFAQSPQSFASVGAALLGACESWICISFSGTQNGRKAIRNLRCASRTAPVGHEMQLTKLLYFALVPAEFCKCWCGASWCVRVLNLHQLSPPQIFQGSKVLKALSPVHLRQCAPLAADTIEHEAIFHLECAEVKAKAVRVISVKNTKRKISQNSNMKTHCRRNCRDISKFCIPIISQVYNLTEAGQNRSAARWHADL